MRKRCIVAVLIVAAFVAARSVHAEILCEVSFSPDDGLIIAPIAIGRTTFRCCLDTGTTKSTFSPIVLPELGEFAGTNTAVALDNRQRQVSLYRSPLLGSRRATFRPDSVAVTDVSRFEDGLGCEMKGFIGCDFLRNFVLEIDPDHAVVRLHDKLASTPKGTKFEIHWKAPNRWEGPQLRIGLPSGEDTEFIVDTGATFGASGHLHEGLFDRMIRSRVSSPGPPSHIVNVLGQEALNASCFTESIQFGNQLIDVKLRWLRGQSNRVSLDFLSRFHVFLDFPNNVAFLESSRRLHVPDSYDLSGIHFLRKNNEAFIDLIDRESPAEQAGIRRGDILLGVEDCDTASTSYVRLRKMLGVRKGPVHVRVKRGDQELNFELRWKELPIVPLPVVKQKFLDDD